MNTDTYGMVCSWLGMFAGAAITLMPSFLVAIVISTGISLVCAGLSRYAVPR